MDYSIPDQQSPEWVTYTLDALKRTAEYLAIMKAGGFEANVWHGIDLIEWLQHDKHELGREVEYLRGELANVQRDRMAHAEVERLRELITECAEAVKGLNDAGMGEGRVPRFLDAFDALREEANR